MSRNLLVLILLNIQSTFAVVRVFPGEFVEDCSDGGRFKTVDFSAAGYEYTSDNDFELKGELKFHHEIKRPVLVEKFDRGQWHTSILNRHVDDLCATLQNPAEPLYGFFSKFKKKTCPYPAGYVEKFGGKEKMSLAPKFIPYSLIGKYRITMKYMFPKYTDCAIVPFDVMDV